MRKNYYKLQFQITNNTRSIIQKILLIISFISDFFAVMFLIDTFLSSYYYAFAVIGMILLSTVLRIISMRLNYSFVYNFADNKVIIRKNTAMSGRQIAEIYLSEIDSIALYSELNTANNVIFAISKQEEVIPKYCVIVNGYTVIMHIDEYLMAVMINGGAKVDVVF